MSQRTIRLEFRRSRSPVDFIVDADRVVLANGRWMRFNQDYLEFLDNYLQKDRR